MKKRIAITVPGCVAPTVIKRSLPLTATADEIKESVRDALSNHMTFGILSATQVKALLESPTQSLKVNDFNYRWRVKEK